MAKQKSRHWMVLRAERELSNRFMLLIDHKGWTMQKALERIVTAWVESEEKEMKRSRG